MNRGGQLERLTRFFYPPYQNQNQRSSPPAGDILRERETPCKCGLFLYFSLSLCYNMCKKLDEIRPHKKCRRNAE